MLERFEQLLEQALLHNTTDIHFEIKDQHRDLTISMRTVHGFKKVKSCALDFKLVEYLKYTANLNLIHFDKPQSGAFSYLYKDEEYYFRVASIKSHFMEVCVVRILNKFYIDRDIFSDIQEKLDYLLTQDFGLVVFSGPTGSGKTTSMYTLMQLYEDKKIYCIEDPIEIYFDNIVQIDLNRNRGFGYKEAITQILRHDPDIICIGEIRDEDAAQMAIRAAFTGHLVLCTVHATNSKLTEQRLIDLGVNKQDLKDNLVMILNQRLIHYDDKRKSVYETITYKD